MADTSIVKLWVPVLVLSHALCIACLVLGPFKLLLQHHGIRRFLRRRRSSVGGKLPKIHDSDDETEDDQLDQLDLGPSPGLQQQEQPQQRMTYSSSPAPAAANLSGAKDDAKQLSTPATPVERMRLEWQQICCFYDTAQGRIVVLQDVWGQADPGEMQALMGPSGAGKSTLMDIIAQRKSMGNLSGFLLVNGQPASGGFIRKTAYVPQEDNFVATMSASETLSFYASIILPSSWSKGHRKQRVGEVLAAMGLKHRAATLVGGTLPGGLMLRGLSGGERKRLSIAAGILATPSVIFLDEPTSGLDSFAALTVMGFLKRMARDKGHVVLSSIHQPRSAIWNMFDKVTLVASGRLMFHGAREAMVPWFGSLGYAYDAAQHGVASDWALDLVAIGFTKPTQLYGHSITTIEQLQAASAAFVASYRAHSGAVLFRGGSESMMIGTKSLKHRVRARMAKYSGVTQLVGGASGPGAGSNLQVFVGAAGSGISTGTSASTSEGGATATAAAVAAAAGKSGDDAAGGAAQLQAAGSKWATGWWRQFSSCYGRELLAVTRNPADVAGRILTFTWVGVLTGVLFYGLPADAGSIMSRMNLLFSNLCFVVLMPYISMSLYTADKKFYLADASAKLYRPHAYYAAKVAATLPFHLVASLVFSFVVYGMAGLRPSARCIWQNGVINSLLSMISVQVMHGCAILAPNQDLAFMLSICWTAIQLLMSNFFITFSSVKLFGITQLRWISAMYYAFEGVALTEFKGMVYSCSQGMGDSSIAFLRYLLPHTKFLTMPFVVNSLKNPGTDCIANANAVLRMYDYGRPFEHTFGILLGYLGLLHGLTYVWMLVVARHEQR